LSLSLSRTASPTPLLVPSPLSSLALGTGGDSSLSSAFESPQLEFVVRGVGLGRAPSGAGAWAKRGLGQVCAQPSELRPPFPPPPPP
jgi:hypothetical protein